MEKFDKTKIKEYQELYTKHSKEASKYKRWIQDIIKSEKKQIIRSAPLFIKDIDYVVSYLKEVKRPVEIKELIAQINDNYTPVFKRWKHKLDSGIFHQYIGQYLQRDFRVSNWNDTSKYMKTRQTRFFQIKDI